MPLHAGLSFAVFVLFVFGVVVLRLLTLPHTPTPFTFKNHFFFEKLFHGYLQNDELFKLRFSYALSKYING